MKKKKSTSLFRSGDAVLYGGEPATIMDIESSGNVSLNMGPHRLGQSRDDGWSTFKFDVNPELLEFQDPLVALSRSHCVAG